MSKIMFPLCFHRGHYEFKAKRLVYKGLGNYDYAYFTVYSHHKKWSKAREDILCNKEYGVYVKMGTPKELDLIIVYPKGEGNE
ncbi:hypothetical protein B9Q01_10580 [Candidatus Marsarchaeota G1 archaeon OSP_D]|jgi:hypothetical protein|uniref:Uncharacterized protein n=1 Tax=Candidatus Marsarchaeota G1 archaeon OSP_D TaxID=1978155 RepID=A0A2R6A5Y2_9ARCH|nr:MAG: hypothetical protein B9Q01_10580 [Candidatus Marsarchaeota G1 archaeon OSP_D]